MKRHLLLNRSSYGLMTIQSASALTSSPDYPNSLKNSMKPLRLLMIVYTFIIGFSAIGFPNRAISAEFNILIFQEASTDVFINNTRGLHDSFMASLKSELSNIGFNIKVGKKNAVTDQERETKNEVMTDKLNLVLTSKFFKLSKNLYIPALELKTKHDGIIIASVKTTPLRTSGEVIKLNMQLESAAISLSRMIFSRLQDINWGEIKFQKNPWETETQSLRLRLIGMNGCLKNHFIDTVEREFPGSLSISALNEVTVGTSQYDLKTNAKVRYVTKWLRALLHELGLTEGNDFVLSLQKSFVAIQKSFVTLELFPVAKPYGVGC